MAKLKIILSSIILVITMFSMSVRAEELSGVEIDNDIRDYSMIYLHSDGILSFSLTMADEHGTPRYQYYDFGEYGYVVKDIIDGYISEARDSDNPFPVLEGRQYIYKGPMDYWEVTDNGLVQLLPTTDSGCCAADADSIVQTGGEAILNSVVPPDAEGHYLQHGVPHFVQASSYYINGVTYKNCCASVAAAMWLRYLDLHENGNYIPSVYETSDGQEIIKIYIPFIQVNGATQGAYPNDIKEGVNLLFWLGNHNRSITLADWSAAVYCSKLDNDKPVIIPINNYHVGVGHGYTQNGLIIMDDGLGNGSLYLSPNWVSQMLY